MLQYEIVGIENIEGLFKEELGRFVVFRWIGEKIDQKIEDVDVEDVDSVEVILKDEYEEDYDGYVLEFDDDGYKDDGFDVEDYVDDDFIEEDYGDFSLYKLDFEDELLDYGK